MGKPDNGIPGALGEIKDSAIILGLANEYLCLDPILIKIGRVIDRNVDKTREEISSLLNQFPGKLPREIDIEGLLSEIQTTARLLQQPDEDLSEKCRIGELGKDLEDKTRTLAGAIKDLRGKVERGGPSYSRLESFLGLFGVFGKAGGFLVRILSWTFRIVIVLLILSILTGAYLFITTEREPGVLKKIAAAESEIRLRQEAIFALDTKRNELVHRMANLEKKDLLRKDKIEIMDLEVEIHRINTEEQKMQFEIDQRKKIINQNKKKIEDIRKKPFRERMLEPVRLLLN